VIIFSSLCNNFPDRSFKPWSIQLKKQFENHSQTVFYDVGVIFFI